MSTTPTPAVTHAPEHATGHLQYYWLWIVCLLGLDYFSTLAYQPSITWRTTGVRGPLATLAVVIVTLFGALPVYWYLAGRSPGGQGSLGILEKLIRGWRGKTLVLILLGFAATDFTMLKSLSLADAAVHVLNKHDGGRLDGAKQLASWLKVGARDYCSEEVVRHIDEQLIVTILLGVVAFVFWFLLRKGFNRNVIVLAVPLVALYLLMTGVLIVAGLWHLNERRDLLEAWSVQVQHVNRIEVGWGTVIVLSVLALPHLALGLSGFELSMILMPQVEGKPGEEPPRTRIRNTRKVLTTAAVVMSAYLLGAVLVTTLLIPADQLGAAGLANNRALAYLAHGGTLTIDGPLAPFCGVVFGTIYDIVTVLILCLAGTSVMTALSVLLPQFLLRFGMEFRWAHRWGLLLILFASINFGVTLWFKANVENQRGAYATGVLVLMACAAVVTALDLRQRLEPTPAKGWRLASLIPIAIYSLIAVVFVTTMLVIAMRSASGLGISLCFIGAILAMSVVSRAWRADELRTIGFAFKDEQSKFLWENLRLAHFPVLVPLRPGRDNHAEKEARIRVEHQLAPDTDVVFLEIHVGDPSDFFQSLLIEVVRQDNRTIIKATHCVSAPHAIAAIALELSRHSRPPSLHFGWPELELLAASWSYLAFGEGNIPWKVRELIQRAEKDPAKRPRVIVG